MNTTHHFVRTVLVEQATKVAENVRDYIGRWKMTNEYIMAFSRIDDWIYDNRINDNYKEVDAEMDIVKKACIKADKYRWHDLRKNPKDLPRQNVQVLCAWQGGTRLWTDTFFYHTEPRKHFRRGDTQVSIVGTEKFSEEGQIVKWKYIDLEEVEE